MRRTVAILAFPLFILFVSFIGGCSSPAPKTPPQTASFQAPAAVDAGHVVVGDAPPAANGMSAIVILEPDPPRDLPIRDDKPVMDQVNQMFTPSVIFAQTGQPVEFHNSDDELHNIDVKEDTTKKQAFNAAIITGGVYSYTFHEPGLYDVRCDIHQAMSALIVVAASPFAKLADADGHFEFDNVDAGTYTVRAYVGSSRLTRPLDVRGPRTDVSIRN
jgi:plastocyanin